MNWKIKSLVFTAFVVIAFKPALAIPLLIDSYYTENYKPSSLAVSQTRCSVNKSNNSEQLKGKELDKSSNNDSRPLKFKTSSVTTRRFLVNSRYAPQQRKLSKYTLLGTSPVANSRIFIEPHKLKTVYNSSTASQANVVMRLSDSAAIGDMFLRKSDKKIYIDSDINNLGDNMNKSFADACVLANMR